MSKPRKRRSASQVEHGKKNAPAQRRRVLAGCSIQCVSVYHEGAHHVALPLPNPILHPNARANRFKRAKAIKEDRWLSAKTTHDERRTHPIKAATYQLTFYLRRKMDYDGLGAWVKAYIDGFVDAGLLADDDDFRPVGIQRHCGCKETGVVFEIREVLKESEAKHG